MGSFDAKGIETVRRDQCPATAKVMQEAIQTLFVSKDISKLKEYLCSTWTKMLEGRLPLDDFIFAKAVKGNYSIANMPPAAIVANRKAMSDPRAEPRYGERVQYIIVNGAPGTPPN